MTPKSPGPRRPRRPGIRIEHRHDGAGTGNCQLASARPRRTAGRRGLAVLPVALPEIALQAQPEPEASRACDEVGLEIKGMVSDTGDTDRLSVSLTIWYRDVTALLLKQQIMIGTLHYVCKPAVAPLLRRPRHGVAWDRTVVVTLKELRPFHDDDICDDRDRTGLVNSQSSKI